LDSQPVRLLVNGYLNGWLTFKYPNQTSRLREDIILMEMMRKMHADIYFLKTIKDASMAEMYKETYKVPNKSYDGYLRSVLPSLLSGSTIVKDVHEMTKEEIEAWKQEDIEMNKRLKAAETEPK
jgi:hypothetical protein